MQSSTDQEQRNRTRFHNVDVLNLNGYRRENSSSVYKNNAGTKILSPGVSQGKEGMYWFDIRKVNLERMKGNSNNWVLVRIVPDMFSIVKLNEIQRFCTEETQNTRRNSGIVWAFFCELDEINKIVKIVSTSQTRFTTNLLIKEEIMQKVKRL